MIRASEHFRSDESRRHSDWLRQQGWFIKAKQDQDRRAKAEERAEDDLASLAVEIVMATEVQIRAFERRLDRYDEASVAALMENREALDAVRARLDAYLAQAYVMEDGRRVFRTEDGSQVFDEFGTEVSGAELDFDAIPPGSPTWEAYRPDFEARQALEAERSAILAYQNKLDDAREASSDGAMSIAEMDDLDAELLNLMPASVRAHAGVEPASPETVLTSSFAAPARDGTAPDIRSPAPSGGTGHEKAFTPGG